MDVLLPTAVGKECAMDQTQSSVYQRMVGLSLKRHERLQRFFDWRPELAALYLGVYAASGKRLLVKDAIGRTQLPQSSGMRAIEECVARDYLRRSPDPADARRVFVVATPRLTDLVERYLDAEIRAVQADIESLAIVRAERAEVL